jgi:hypothetical protein
MTFENQPAAKAEISPAPRRRFDITRSAQRSAIANGSRLLDGLDARSAPARRYRDLANAIAQDIGGLDVLTQAQLQLARSASGLVVLREALDAKLLRGEPVDVAAYCRISNSLRRLLSTIGLKRVPTDITPPPLRERLAVETAEPR